MSMLLKARRPPQAQSQSVQQIQTVLKHDGPNHLAFSPCSKYGLSSNTVAPTTVHAANTDYH